MTPNDLKRLEATIGRTLSPALREFFLNFPPGLHVADEDHDPDGSDFELTDDVEALIQMNSEGWGRVWLANAGLNFFALGCGGCGETWWVDLDDPRGAVYFADAGTEAEFSDHLADSIGEFAQRMLDARRGE